MDAILTTYPLSRDFQDRLATVVAAGALRLSVSELRQRPYTQMFKYLRSLRVDRLFVPMEDENSSALLPVLKVMASVIKARSIYVLDSSLQSRRISRLDAIGAVFNLVRASATALVGCARAKREMPQLLAQERLPIRRPVGRNLLYLNANLWFGVKAGGSVGHISGVVNGLLQHDHAVDFISAGGRLMVGDKAYFEQLTPPPHFGFPWELNYYRFHFDVVEQIAELRMRRPVDLIYQRLSLANYSGVTLSRRFNVPLILEYNGSETWIAKNWGRQLREQALAEQVEEVNLRHAHLIVTISDVLRDELLARGVPAHRIVNYPNCIDPGMFDPARFSEAQSTALRRRHGIAPDAVVVTFVGTFGQWHGAEVLAAAIRRLIDGHRTWLIEKKVNFMLVGDGFRMADVRSILGSDAQGPHVTLVGLVPQREAPAYLAASDILASPHVPNPDGSRFFGSPTKLFEYMAMGKAIVASDLDQVGQVLANALKMGNLPVNDNPDSHSGQMALLCEPGSAAELSEGIRFLVNHPGWRARLGHNARREALERYTWKQHVAAILAGFAACE